MLRFIREGAKASLRNKRHFTTGSEPTTDTEKMAAELGISKKRIMRIKGFLTIKWAAEDAITKYKISKKEVSRLLRYLAKE